MRMEFVEKVIYGLGPHSPIEAGLTVSNGESIPVVGYTLKRR